MSAQADVKVVGSDVANVIFSDTRLTQSATVAADMTLSANGVTDGIAEYVDRSGGIVIGYPRMTAQLRKPTQVSRVFKASYKVFVPRLATTAPSTNTGIEPAPTKAYECQAHIDFLLPERSTTEERKQLYTIVASLFCGSVSASDGDPVISTGSPIGDGVIGLIPVY
jgi:hypothetical protein